ncbi:MAG: hypothetical protein NTX27_17960 [Verrucomicrobia bacterium]|nr:hypothetical protein [Verrucomicrobiota bacterium]
MKHLIIIIASSLFLFGCGKQASHSENSKHGFKLGTGRDAIVKQLEVMHARTLKDKPDLLLAEFSLPEMKRPMQVELTFGADDQKLHSVNYIPQ